MTRDELVELLNDRSEDDFLKFDRVQNKLSKRPDLHAFLLLDSLLPGTRDIVAGAMHDQIWLCSNVDDLAEVISVEQVKDLVRCGVMYDSYSLAMSA